MAIQLFQNILKTLGAVYRPLNMSFKAILKPLEHVYNGFLNIFDFFFNGGGPPLFLYKKSLLYIVCIYMHGKYLQTSRCRFRTGEHIASRSISLLLSWLILWLVVRSMMDDFSIKRWYREHFQKKLRKVKGSDQW